MQTFLLAGQLEWLFLLILAFFLFAGFCISVGFYFLSSKSFIKKLEQKNNSRHVQVQSKKKFFLSLGIFILAVYFVGARFLQIYKIDIENNGVLSFKNGWNIPIGSIQKENIKQVQAVEMRSIRGYNFGRIIIITDKKTYIGLKYTPERAQFVKKELEALK